jgi:hypothetical protein
MVKLKERIRMTLVGNGGRKNRILREELNQGVENIASSFLRGPAQLSGRVCNYG